MKYLSVLFLLLFTLNILASNSYDTNSVNKFIDEMYEKHDYKKDDLRKLFGQIKEEKKLKKFFKKAPERRLTWNGCKLKEKQCINYKKLFVNKHNIENGKVFMLENIQDLEKASERFGVPKEIIVAIIGIETRYGKNLGKFKTFDTLASLSLGPNKGRRHNFYRSELENFLLLCDENNLDPSTIKGSYAGALGKPQFISSSYRNYAIDFDNDDYADLWNSNADVIGSVANYLKRNGWSRDGLILTDLVVDNNESSLEKLSKRTYKPHTVYKKYLNLKIFSPKEINTNEKLSIIKRIEGNKNVYSFGHNNFYTITRYNRSRLYALAVYTLAQEIKIQSQ
jgi:membrane-bound lytic murein transglycosylase B